MFNPTHVTRRKALFDEAVTLAGNGCYIDLTAFPVEDGEDAWSAAEGRVEAGADADLVALDATGGAHTVIIRGEIHVRDGRAVRRGTFENRQEQHVAEHRP